MLRNLVRNALRHTPSDASVAVVVRRDRDEVEVAVEVTGEGLPPEAERRMVEGFWRGDRARGGEAAPAWGSPSPAGWWRLRAGASGPRTGR